MFICNNFSSTTDDVLRQRQFLVIFVVDLGEVTILMGFDFLGVLEENPSLKLNF